ncbi:MAG: hypothetical protein CNLJKLNK_00804 [Holosporales bacterium]
MRLKKIIHLFVIFFSFLNGEVHSSESPFQTCEIPATATPAAAIQQESSQQESSQQESSQQESSQQESSQQESSQQESSQQAAISSAVSQQAAISSAVSQQAAISSAVSQQAAISSAVSRQAAISSAVSQQAAISSAVSQQAAIQMTNDQNSVMFRGGNPMSEEIKCFSINNLLSFFVSSLLIDFSCSLIKGRIQIPVTARFIALFVFITGLQRYTQYRCDKFIGPACISLLLFSISEIEKNFFD